MYKVSPFTYGEEKSDVLQKFHLFLISLICLVLRVGNLKNLIRSISMNKKKVEEKNGLGPWSQVGKSNNVRK